MTAYSPYQDFADSVPVLVSPPPILVAVADPVPQPRFGVAFRLLLVIPQTIAVGVLGIVAAVFAFVGWWAALFTGQLPEFAVTFLSGFLRWAARVRGYTLMLTDAYPPFTLDDDPGYPVRIAIPDAQPLNRAAVFFRYFIAIPASILLFIVTMGACTLMAFIAWLVTLVMGRMPASLHLAYVAVLRFEIRYTGYYYMLTPAYPGSLYGDGPGAVAWTDELPPAPAPAPAPAPGWGSPQGYGAPIPGYDPTVGYGASAAPAGYGTPVAGYGTPVAGYGAPVAGYGAPAEYSLRPVFQPATWLLPLTSAARKLMTAFIVIGSLIAVLYIALFIGLIASAARSANNNNTASNAMIQLSNSYTALTTSLTTWEQATTACDQNLTCVTKEDSTAASAFEAFSSQLSATAVPSGAEADKARLTAVSASAAQDFTRLSQATSNSQYQSVISSTGLESTLNSVDSDYTALVNNLQTYNVN
jgi:Domain of unknown function (DUF4389)